MRVLFSFLVSLFRRVFKMPMRRAFGKMGIPLYTLKAPNTPIPHPLTFEALVTTNMKLTLLVSNLNKDEGLKRLPRDASDAVDNHLLLGFFSVMALAHRLQKRELS